MNLGAVTLEAVRRVGKGATSAFTRVFDVLWRRAHAFLLGAKTWARRLRGFAHPTIASHSGVLRERRMQQ
jgi:hypothetical protein